MASKLNDMLTTENVKTVLTVALKVAKAFKNRSDNWTNKTRVSLVTSILAIAGMIGCLAYFIVTHRITPLMLYIAACIPILAFGLTVQGKNLDKIKDEFDEYTDAMNNLLAVLKNACQYTGEEAVEVTAAVLMATQNLSQDELNVMTYSDIKMLPSYAKASRLVISLHNINEAVSALKSEGEDVDEILANLDLSEMEDAGNLFDEDSLYTSITGTANEEEKKEAEAALEEMATTTNTSSSEDQGNGSDTTTTSSTNESGAVEDNTNDYPDDYSYR